MNGYVVKRRNNVLPSKVLTNATSALVPIRATVPNHFITLEVAFSKALSIINSLHLDPYERAALEYLIALGRDYNAGWERLGKECCTSSTRVAKACRDLEDRGLVEISRGEFQRSLSISLTSKARDMLSAALR